MGNVCQQESEKLQNVEYRGKRLNKSRALAQDSGNFCETKINLSALKAKIQNSASIYNIVRDFQVISQLGKGGQAQIFEVKVTLNSPGHCPNQNQQTGAFALKKVEKNNEINRRESLEVGKSILNSNACPFIINGINLQEDDGFIYQLLEKAGGGDLQAYICNDSARYDPARLFGQTQMRFVLAGVVLGLEYLHSRNFIYCDLKSENVLIGDDGYPLLSDFEMSCEGRFTSAMGFRGTIAYVAPEVFAQENVDRAIDLWALGVLAYKMANGCVPFAATEIKANDFWQKCKLKQGQYRINGRSKFNQLENLINLLLKVSPQGRIGYCSLAQVKYHKFFANFDWYKYSKKQLDSPLKSLIPLVNASRPPSTPKLPLNPSQVLPIWKQLSKSDRQTACQSLLQVSAEYPTLQA